VSSAQIILIHFDTCTATGCCSREILVRCEQLLLMDVELSHEKNVEQLLWKSVFHSLVELTRKQLADDPSNETRVTLNKVLDEVTPL